MIFQIGSSAILQYSMCHRLAKQLSTVCLERLFRWERFQDPLHAFVWVQICWITKHIAIHARLMWVLMSYHSFGKFPNISDPGSIMFMDLSMIPCLDIIVVMFIIMYIGTL